MAIDFRIKDFFYPIGIYKLRRTFERNQWLAPDALFAYQEKRLAMIINHAYNHVPYYRRLFKKLGLRPSDIKNRDDLKRLPILSKDIVRKERVNLIADNAKKYNPLVGIGVGPDSSLEIVLQSWEAFISCNAIILAKQSHHGSRISEGLC
jgi:hypothetical protein